MTTEPTPAAKPFDPARCKVCGWPLAVSQDKGCVEGDCSYRPESDSPEGRRVYERARLVRLEIDPDAPPSADADGESDAAFVERMHDKWKHHTRPTGGGDEINRLIALARLDAAHRPAPEPQAEPNDAGVTEVAEAIWRARVDFHRDGFESEKLALVDQAPMIRDSTIAEARAALEAGARVRPRRDEGARASASEVKHQNLKPGDPVFIRAIVKENVGATMPTNWPVRVVLDAGQSETIDTGGSVHFSALYTAAPDGMAQAIEIVEAELEKWGSCGAYGRTALNQALAALRAVQTSGGK